MWETQTLFRVSAKLAAEGIFNSLDRALEPDIFLLGYAVDTAKTTPKLFVEPANIPYPHQVLNKVKSLARAMRKTSTTNTESRTYIYDEFTHKRLIRQRYMSTAIEQVLNTYTAVDETERYSFCSLPAPINGYSVFVVLQFNKAAYQSHYRLQGNRLPDNSEKAVSLLDATVFEFLRDCLKALKELETEPGSGMHIIDRDYNEILRAAGKRFMYTPAYGLHGLFDACNAIASMRYEQAESIGGILIARQGHPNIKVVLALESPIPMREYRTVRKLLEITDEGISLLSDAVFIYGLGRLEGEYDAQYEDLFSICFTTYYTWQLQHAEHAMMKVSFGLPTLPRGEIDKNLFLEEAHQVFQGLEPNSAEILWHLAEKAFSQQKGSIVLISAGAEAEAERLFKQSFKIKPFLMTTDMLRMVTNIDGAVLLSPDGFCHAIGVILDGLASERGEPARGSRFNSAVRYAESSSYDCLAIVVSEDGIVNLITPSRYSSVLSPRSR